jgi:glycosyltransferase involved in cell wall biosynthesis
VSELGGLRVALVAGTLGQGGAERQLYYVAATLRGAGARPLVLSLARGEHWEGPLREAGVPVEWVGARPGRAARLMAVTRAAARHRADLLQSFHFYANPYAALAARALRRPDLGAVRGSGQADLDSVGGVMGRLCVWLPRLLVANSDAAVTRLQQLGVPRRRLRLLPNVIDVNAFVPSAADEAARPFTVAAIGRLDANKRFDRALRVVASARPRIARDVRLIVAGAGPDRSALEALAVRLGLGGQVTFAGAVADIRPLLGQADCLLLTSDAEGTPNVILEAMAAARPVIATAVGGVSALVEPGRTGLLAARDDEAALAGAVVRLAGDPGLTARMGRQGRARVSEHYSLQGLEEHLRALYREVLPSGTRGHEPGDRP